MASEVDLIKNLRKEVFKMTVENLTTAFGNITTLVGDVMEIIGANPVLMMCFSAGLIGIVIGVVRKLKHA